MCYISNQLILLRVLRCQNHKNPDQSELQESKQSIPPLTSNQKGCVLICFAIDMEPAEIVRFFRLIFMNFGAGIPDEKVHQLLRNRFKQLKRNNASKITELREILSDYPYKHIPITIPDFQLMYLQSLLDICIENFDVNSEKNILLILRIFKTVNNLLPRAKCNKLVSADYFDKFNRKDS